MGAQYTHLILPKDNTLRPHPTSLYYFIESLIEAGYLLAPKGEAEDEIAPNPSYCTTKSDCGAEAQTFPMADKGECVGLLNSDNIHLSWKFSDLHATKTKHPLDFGMSEEEFWAQEPLSYELIIHLTHDFQQQCSGENAAYIENTICQCGTNLSYQPEGETLNRLKYHCPVCQTIFKPQTQLVSFGEGLDLRGGMANRFSIEIKCGENFVKASPAENPLVTMPATDEFISLCKEIFDTDFSEIGFLG